MALLAERDAAVASAVPRQLTTTLFDIQTENIDSIGMANKAQSKAGVLQGTLDLMVLQTLSSLGALHGYAIAERIEQVSGGTLQLNMGTLYPSLMRLEQRGFVKGDWGVTSNNRKARYYRITPAGRRGLTTEKRGWDRMVSIIDQLFAPQS